VAKPRLQNLDRRSSMPVSTSAAPQGPLPPEIRNLLKRYGLAVVLAGLALVLCAIRRAHVPTRRSSDLEFDARVDECSPARTAPAGDPELAQALWPCRGIGGARAAHS